MEVFIQRSNFKLTGFILFNLLILIKCDNDVCVLGDYIDNRSTSAGQIMSITYFWFISTTQLYCFLCFIIPEYITDDWVKLTLTVTVVFVYIESVINWFYTRTQTSFYTVESGTTDHNNMAHNTCHICNVIQPLRSHHCKICNKCVLKRDHHCFMIGTCIGFYNQRYFTILNVYIAIASIGGFVFTYLYLKWKFVVTSYWDVFLPVTVYNWWCGSLPAHQVFLMFHMYTLWWTACVSIGFVIMQLNAILQGKTTQEVKKSITIQNEGTMSDHLTSVFGPNWFISLLFPTGRQSGDGLTWTRVKHKQNSQFDHCNCHWYYTLTIKPADKCQVQGELCTLWYRHETCHSNRVSWCQLFWI